ncbi:glycine--tRNA ligase [Candidatus Micrarchaeota archaeon CG10_big_fil_rev_8_21_14_0_10_59_7]|nr:MAG: glycine--tRNA ligase [Candidatus Micrarchaeota archaeon CG10_big_fil_rev_8_21_14_0_10_59_7]
MASVMEKVVNLCSRRGFVLASADAYGQLAGFFEYAGYGAQLKRNLEESWWSRFVKRREDVVGIDGALLLPRAVWKASGHLDAFNDPLVSCVKCRSRFRADHLVEEELKLSVEGMPMEKLAELIKERKLRCPKCKGELGEAKPFNLMFKTFAGAVTDESSEIYLRPETAQNIFTDYKTVALAARKQVPFGIAQLGRAFRNEIAPRNFLFRVREFTQVEIEYFVHPDKLNECALPEGLLSIEIAVLTADAQEKKKDASVLSFSDMIDKKVIGTKWHAYWLADCVYWLQSLGLKKKSMRLRQHVAGELSHYSRETWDIEFDYGEWGWKELLGVANRGDYDVTQHAKASGKDFSLYDEASKQKFVPVVIEPSGGIDRVFLAILVDAFEEKPDKNVLHLRPEISPVTVAVFPLMKKDGLAEKGRAVFEELRKHFSCEYDESGSIGRRYARQDEVGTPYCVTIDYQTLEDGTVTVRDRDSGKQVRFPLEQVEQLIRNSMEQFTNV